MKRVLLPMLALALLVGCRGSKVHQSFKSELSPGGSRGFMVEAPRKEQKIKVVMTATEPINVWLILDKDLPDDIEPETLKAGVLAKEKATKSATLTGTIPAKETFRVYINGATKTAQVEIQIDSQ